VLIAQTAQGIARLLDGRYELLDTHGQSLADLVCSGRIHEAANAKVARAGRSTDLPDLLPPIAQPGKFCIVGLNYSDHADEINAPHPTSPRFSYVPGSALAGPADDIVLPSLAPAEVDYEGELAVVIGRTAESVDEAAAWSHVAGLTIANDVSARDVQLGRHRLGNGQNVGLGKGFPTFKPLGPALLTVEDIDAGNLALRIRTIIDGEVRQDSTTRNFLFDIPTLIATISRFCRLDPGDVILTGTPGGVGMTSGRYLCAGQLVEVEIERIGVIRNRVRAAR
jgi:2-keto-4-pentenoate hydratase/2-oxohepta-3-ene-1,7-dioic acid hydratase in catechol pathway